MEISIENGTVKGRLEDKTMRATIADGAVIYRAVKQGNTTPIKDENMKDPSVILDADTLVVRGKLEGGFLLNTGLLCLPGRRLWKKR